MDSGVKQDYTAEKNYHDGYQAVEGQDGQSLGTLGNTVQDGQDMWRMGKDQELKRNFRRFSIFCFTMVLMATWEGQFTAIVFGLLNGGTGGVIWTYVGVYAGFFCAILSMAEMASMAPTSGGQYHWISEFAPPSQQKFLSYIMGWLAVLGWQVGINAVAFVIVNLIVALAVLCNPSYSPQRWQETLLIILVITIAILFNTVLSQKLPHFQIFAFFVHTAGFLAVVITLWVMGNSTRPSASSVFFTFTDGGGWGNIGLSCLIGSLTPIFAFIGPDSATHMSEELKDASKALPKAMIATLIFNGILGWIALITVCFMIGDLNTVLNTPTGQPLVQIFFDTTNSNAGTCVLVTLIIIPVFFGCVDNVATASRQLFAFARDKGVPFHAWLAHVEPRWNLPLNAIALSWTINVLLSLINIGSTIAFNVIASLAVSAIVATYMISIGCMTVKRLRREPLLPSYFSLGRFGLAINAFSVLSMTLIFIMTFFPQSPNPTLATMNWTALVFGAVVIFSVAYFVFKGRFEYDGPVEYVRKEI